MANQSSGAQMPNPEEFDFDDPEDMQRYQAETENYIAGEVRKQVEAAMGPHRESVQHSQWTEEFQALERKYGRDPDYKANFDAAVQDVMDSGGELSIVEAYQRVAGENDSRRKNKHLPEKLRSGKKAVGALGQLMDHHSSTRQAERVNPFTKQPGIPGPGFRQNRG